MSLNCLLPATLSEAIAPLRLECVVNADLKVLGGQRPLHKLEPLNLAPVIMISDGDAFLCDAACWGRLNYADRRILFSPFDTREYVHRCLVPALSFDAAVEDDDGFHHLRFRHPEGQPLYIAGALWKLSSRPPFSFTLLLTHRTRSLFLKNGVEPKLIHPDEASRFLGFEQKLGLLRSTFGADDLEIEYVRKLEGNLDMRDPFYGLGEYTNLLN